MDIRQLTYFVQIAKSQSFTMASKTLHVSQPGLSKMIKSLESELGFQLIDRSERHIKLTDAGESLLEQAVKILDAFNDMSKSLSDTVNLNKGNVTIGIPPVIGTIYFPKIIADFRNKYPGVTLVINENGAQRVQEKIEEGTLDLGIVILPVDTEKFQTIPIIRDENMLIVHQDHPLANRESVRVAELRDESFVILNEKFMLHHHIIEACKSEGFEPNISLLSSQWDFIAEMVSWNQGISILPKPILNKYNCPHIRLIPIDHSLFSWEIAMIHKKNGYISFAMKAFMEHVQEALEPHR